MSIKIDERQVEGAIFKNGNIYFAIFLRLILMLSLLILILVYAMEYIFGMQPCSLCKYERIPYALMLIISGFSIFISNIISQIKQRKEQGVAAAIFKNGNRYNWSKIISMLIVLISFSGAALGFYHVGIENNWFESEAGCMANTAKVGVSVEEFRAQIMQNSLTPCNYAVYHFMEVSIAGWNFIMISFIFAFSSIFSLLRRDKYDKI